ncbi:MAG: helix-turn-helix transcriptional regulator [Geminicoccaceae bacterium]
MRGTRTDGGTGKTRIQTPRVAQLTGLSIRCIQLMAARGEVPSAAQLGRRWTFDEKRIVEWVAQRESDACQKTSTSVERSGGVASKSPDVSIERACALAIGLSPKQGKPNGRRA